MKKGETRSGTGRRRAYGYVLNRHDVYVEFALRRIEDCYQREKNQLKNNSISLAGDVDVIIPQTTSVFPLYSFIR